MNKLWIAFPLYKNDAHTLELFLKDLLEVKETLGSSLSKISLLAVKDGLSDSSASVDRLLCRYDMNLISHQKNQGVVQALLSALMYVENNGDITDYMAWLDSDGEHNPHDLISGFNIIKNNKADVALTQVYYQPHHLAHVDTLFNKFMGAIQDEILFGKNNHFLHNCPGCWISRTDLFPALIPLYGKYMAFYKEEAGREMRWGEDMTFFRMATYLGAKINYESIAISKIPAPNRTNEKIIDQTLNNITHLKLYADFFKKIENKG